MATTIIDGKEVTYAPILKGQEDLEKPLDPAQVAGLAAGGAEFHNEYLMSHGGSWSDPFSGVQIGLVEDWSGVTRYWSADPGAAGPPGMFEAGSYFGMGGARTGDFGPEAAAMATSNIQTKAGEIDLTDPVAEQKLIDDTAQAIMANTFTPDRVAAAAGWDAVYGEGYLDSVRATGTGMDLLTGGRVDSAAGFVLPAADPDPERTVVSRVENADGTTTVTYSDGTNETLAADPLGLSTTFDDPRTAREIVAGALRGYGLEALLDDPELNLIGRWQATNNLDAVWAAVRQAPAYTARFPGMQALADQGRAITESAYVDLEEGYAGALRLYGMAPEYFDSPDDFGDWIAGDVSVSEVTSRLGVATDAVLATSQTTKDLLLTWHGIDASDLTAYFLDPERATTVFEEREMLGAARIGGAAAETGFVPLSKATATTLRAAGVTEAVARAGFAEIAPSTLAYETASESDDITRTELVGAKFGTDPEAARRIEERRQTRLAAFRQTGGPAMTGSGIVGLGSAS